MSIDKYYQELYRYLVDFCDIEPIYNKIKNKNKIISIVEKQIDKHDFERIQPKYRVHLESLILSINGHKYVKDIIVHGSYGDHNIIDYSDIDVTVVINDSVLGCREKLRELKKFWLGVVIPKSMKISPFQHHGPFLLWPDLINNYDEGILPLVVYNDSWSMHGSIYKFSIMKKASPNIKKLIAKISKQGDKSLKSRNIYDSYLFVSNTMLFPAVFLQSIDVEISKKDSFNYIKTMNVNFNFLCVSSKIRQNWARNRMAVLLISILLRIVQYRKPFFVSRYVGYLFSNNYTYSDIRDLQNKFIDQTKDIGKIIKE